MIGPSTEIQTRPKYTACLHPYERSRSPNVLLFLPDPARQTTKSTTRIYFLFPFLDALVQRYHSNPNPTAGHVVCSGLAAPENKI